MYQAKLQAIQVFEPTKMKGNTFTQYHRAVQPLTAIPKLANPPFGLQITHTDCHCTTEKQLAKADHLSVA